MEDVHMTRLGTAWENADCQGGQKKCPPSRMIIIPRTVRARARLQLGLCTLKHNRSSYKPIKQ